MTTTREQILKTAAAMLLDEYRALFGAGAPISAWSLHHMLCDKAREAGKSISTGEALAAAKAVLA